MDDHELFSVLAALQKLSVAGAITEPNPSSDWLSSCQLTESDVQSCKVLGENAALARQLWPLLRTKDISLVSTKRALLGLLQARSQTAAPAMAFCSHLLGAADFPVLGIFDRLTVAEFLKAVRRANFAYLRWDAAGDLKRVEAVAEATCFSWVVDAVLGMAKFLHRFGLRDQPDILRDFAETLGDVARSNVTPGSLADACFLLLKELLQPIHGVVRETAAIIMRPLASGILGLHTAARSLAEGGPPARTNLSIRTQILHFVEQALRRSADCGEGVAALARHVILKAPDKADFRSAAADAATKLVHMLAHQDQHHFVIFAARLSRSAKVSQRIIGIELGIKLYESFPNPFDPAYVADQRHPSATPQPEAQSSCGVSEATAPNSVASSEQSAPSSAGTVVTVIEQHGPPLVAASCGVVCIAILVQRASDKSAAVRSKAIAGLAGIVSACLEKKQDSQLAQLRLALAQAQQVKLSSQFSGNTPTIMAPVTVSPANPNEVGPTPLGEFTPGSVPGGIGASGASFAQRKRGLHRQLLESVFHSAAARTAVPAFNLDLECLVLLARRRARDEKATVRKCSLQLMEGLLLMRLRGCDGAAVELPSEADLAAVEAATADPLVSVRRAGLYAAARLLKELPNEAAVARLWVRAVLPMVRDVEASLQEAVLDQVDSLILSRAVAACATTAQGGPTQAASQAAGSLRSLLGALTELGSAARVCLSQALAAMAAKKRLKGDKAAKGLQSIIADLGSAEDNSGTARSGAWLLLAELSGPCPKAPSWQFLQDQWKLLQQTNSCFNASDGTMLLRVISNAAATFPEAEAAKLVADLLQAVTAFRLAPDAIAAHIAALAQLSDGKRERANWCKDVLAASKIALQEFIQQLTSKPGLPQSTAPQDSPGIAALFTVGEVALLDACGIPSTVTTLVQALTAATLVACQGHIVSVPVPPPVQAHAWVTLGKLCLVDEGLAKKSITCFVQELHSAEAPAVRNNIMLALADLCMQHTALVDSHIPKLAACLSDPHELVRRQGLALLANLLSRDFVKWRGPLFHRFTLSLVDDSPAVRHLAEYLLADTLAAKAPLLAYNHFVESIFMLNNCHDGLRSAGRSSGLSQVPSQPSLQTSDGGASFGLPGSSHRHRDKRDAVYRALLTQMAPEHKFASAAKLCQDVLAGFADEVLSLEQAPEVLRDALSILASKHIKVSVGKSSFVEEDEPENPAAAAGAAKGKVVSAMMRKHLLEGMVPVMVELKRALEARRHPLLAHLMLAMRVLLKDHKNEIEDILVADRQLAKELLYDMKQDELARKAASEAVTARQEVEEQQHAAQPSEEALALLHRPVLQQQSRPSPCPGALPTGTSPSTPAAAKVLAASQSPRTGSLLRDARSNLLQLHRPGSSGHMPQLVLHRLAGTGQRVAPLHTPGLQVVTTTPAGRGTHAVTPGALEQGAVPFSVPRLRKTHASAGQAGLHPSSQAGEETLATLQAVLQPANSRPASNIGAENRAGEEPSSVVVPSPYRESRQKQWNVSPNVSIAEEVLPLACKPVSRTGGPISPVMPLPRASSRLRGSGRKRKATK